MCLPYDLLCLYFLLIIELMFTKLWSTNYLYVILGFCFGGLERFCLGFMFHSNFLKHIHKKDHEKLVDRVHSRSCLIREHLSETVIHVFLLNCYCHVGLFFLNFDYSSIMSLAIGLNIERLISTQIRLLIQHNFQFNNQWYQNMYYFYWWHMCVRGDQSFGFSCPFWDKCNLSFPFENQKFLSLPIPFFDFFLMNVSEREKQLVNDRLNLNLIGTI